MIADDFQIVTAAEEHQRFVLTTWLESYHDAYAAGTFAWKGKPSYEEVYRPSFMGIMSRPGARCDVLVLKESPELFVAWCVVQECKGYRYLVQPILHYIYVKEPYRKSGIARNLLLAAGIDGRKEFRHSHRTRAWDRVVGGDLGRKDGWLGARYDPMMARYPTPPKEWKEEKHEQT